MATDPIGTRIARRRQELRLTQSGLAARLGVNRASVANWEAGKHYPQRHLGALEAILGVSLSGNGHADSYPDPDEAAIWSLTRYTPAERRAMITALRAERAAPTG